MQVANDIKMDARPTAKRLELPLQRRTNRHFVTTCVTIFFLQYTLSASWTVSFMTHSCLFLWGLGLANHGRTIVDELLRKIAGFGRGKQEGLANSPQRAEILSKSRHLTAKIGRLREQIDAFHPIANIWALNFELLEKSWITWKPSSAPLMQIYYRFINS